MTIYGLFVEHTQAHQTVWNGNGGRVYFYQSEMPYDPPSQEAWRSPTGDGYASDRVGDGVTTQQAWRLDVYHVFKRAPVVADSGWKCDSLPYLVEFDNYGRGRRPNVADINSIYVWGWDEISWYSLQDENYRDPWLVYAHNWIKKTDPNGHLQMPVSRMITCPNQTQSSYRANTKSQDCPIGCSREETIKAIWRESD